MSEENTVQTGQNDETPPPSEAPTPVVEEPDKESFDHPGEPCRHPLAQPFIELAEDQKGGWWWVLWAKNGRPMAMSASPYNRRNDASNAAEAARDLMRENPIILIAAS